MEYAVFKQQIMEQAKRILPQEEGYVITIVDQTEYGLGVDQHIIICHFQKNK